MGFLIHPQILSTTTCSRKLDINHQALCSHKRCCDDWASLASLRKSHSANILHLSKNQDKSGVHCDSVKSTFSFSLITLVNKKSVSLECILSLDLHLNVALLIAPNFYSVSPSLSGIRSRWKAYEKCKCLGPRHSF